MNPDLLIIIPSRGRPHSLPRMLDAWRDTAAFEQGAALLFALDADDPTVGDYRRAYDAVPPGADNVLLAVGESWQPMVAKLNRVARMHADAVFAMGFAGDDHVPRTYGWAKRYVEELRALGTGIVYGNDGVQGQRLPTQWAMTSDIVRMLGCMVPSSVEHLYCDDVIRELGDGADCLRYLPDVLIEHMHPFFDKAPMDEGYRRFNLPAQYKRDFHEFKIWQTSQRIHHVAALRALRG